MADVPEGLPEVNGLRDFLANDPEFQDKAQVQDATNAVPPPEEGQGGEEEIDWGQFKNPKDLLKSYKEIQGFTTRVSQENKELRDRLARVEEERELSRLQPQQVPRSPTGRSWEEMFVNDPETAITIKAMEMANTQRITEVLEEKRMQNPNDFPERVAYVQMLARQREFAPFANSPKGVEKLFEIADKQRVDMINRRAHESVKVLLGEDVDLEKLRAIVRKDSSQPGAPQNTPPNRNAFMPPSGTSTTTGADMNAAKTSIQAAKEEALNKGDVAGVAGALLREALLK